MLENWSWNPSILKRLSKHYSYISPQYFEAWKKTSNGKQQPPETLPDTAINSLIRERGIGAAIRALESVHNALFDILAYRPDSRKGLEETNFSVLYHKTLREVIPLEGPAGQGDQWGHGEAHLHHLVVGDYDAGYYGYLL